MVVARLSSFKNLVLSLGFVVLAAIFALFAVIPSAYASGGGCYDVSGQGTGVPVNGVDNSGTVHFDLPLAPVLAYQGCVEDVSAPPPGDGPFQVKGWAWDDNLGWISLYCADEAANGPPYENLGIPCGNFTYGVTMDGIAGTTGRLNGYAWGDNIGWISFNCADGGTCGTSTYYVEAETTDNACLGEVYSSSAPDASCSPNANESTFAWSDSVGWIDFSGVKFPWVELISIAVDVQMEIVNTGGDDLAVVGANKIAAPVADGSDPWNMVLHMTLQYDGSPITPGNYTITVVPTWSDTVDTIQTNLGFDSAATSKPTAFPAGFGAYASTISDAYVGNITSRAPTSSMNGYDDGADGSVDALYENFVLGNPNDPSNVPTNDLILTDVQVSVVHNPTGICAFGGAGCATQSVAGSYLGRNLHFKPAIELDNLSDSINGATISAQLSVANTLNFTTACRGILSGCTGSIAAQTGVNSPFDLVYDAALDGADCTDSQTFTFPFGGTQLQIVPVLEYDGVSACLESGPSTGDDAYIYTTVSYNNGGVISYFSNKLPRVEGTLVVNPVAEIRGNVYSSGVTNPQTGQEVRSLGDVSTNILRNTIVRNVENIVAGVTTPFGAATITGWDSMGTDGFQITGNGVKLILDFLNVPRVFYFADDLTISAAGPDLTWNGERTIIVEGGDLYIDRNLYNTAGLSKPKLGIIVLKDLSSGDGGNVYIAPGVTNIQANIYADGAVFSYDGVPADINGSGEPIFADESTRFNLLKNQLYFEGSIASQNTIGGAVKSPPILGDGTVASAAEGSYGAVPSGRSQARLYDLNFLRYFGLVFERDGTGNAVDQQGDLPGDSGYLELKAKSEGGDLVPITGGLPAQGLNPLEDYSAVYVNFDPPSANLPGFGVTSGVDIRIRN